MLRAGWYGAPGRRRQRWWCVQENGERHRFTEVLPRLVSDPTSDAACDQCQTTLEPWEGLPAPRLYGFAARDIAWALTQVAAGATYRGTAAAVRRRAGRELATQPTATKRPVPNAHAQLVSDWVETFAPVLWEHYAPQRWPEDVLVDSFELRAPRPGTPRGVLAFHVLAVAGYDAEVRRGRPYIAGIAAVPRATGSAWSGLLRARRGQPRWVVTDGGTPSGATATAWPDAELWRCEWHLAKNLRDKLPDSVHRDLTDPIYPLLNHAQASISAWDAFQDALRHRSTREPEWLPAATQAARLDPIVRAQAGSRPDDLPLTTGPLEQFFATTKTVLAPRADRMTNRARADALLLLLAARYNGWMDHAAWTKVISEHLVTRAGRPANQRTHTDPKGVPSLR